GFDSPGPSLVRDRRHELLTEPTVGGQVAGLKPRQGVILEVAGPQTLLVEVGYLDEIDVRRLPLPQLCISPRAASIEYPFAGTGGDQAIQSPDGRCRLPRVAADRLRACPALDGIREIRRRLLLIA